MYMRSKVILNHETLKKGMVVTVLESLILLNRPHHIVEHPILKMQVAVPASKVTTPRIVQERSSAISNVSRN
jgi:hypothetical protein